MAAAETSAAIAATAVATAVASAALACESGIQGSVAPPSVSPPSAGPQADQAQPAADHQPNPEAGGNHEAKGPPPEQTAPSLAQTISLPTFANPAARALPSSPERLLIIDTETTGLSPAKGRCIEVGAVLFHVPSRAVLSQLSFLLPCQSNPAQRVNGIAAEVTQLDQPRKQSLACLEAMADAADVLVAHNAAFDRQWFGRDELPALPRPWLCSMEDIRWPAERHLRATPSVRDLALAYGVPVWAAHRALTDCIYIAQVFERETQLDNLLQQALLPRKLYRARLPYDQRHLAKEAGFRWNEAVQGAWSKRLTEEECRLLTFEVLPAEAEPIPAWPQSA